MVQKFRVCVCGGPGVGAGGRLRFLYAVPKLR